MVAKVLGIQKVDYVNKANKQVLGTSLHITREDKRVTGVLCESIFISDRAQITALPTIAVGSMIDIQYNRFGSIEDVKAVKG